MIQRTSGNTDCVSQNPTTDLDLRISAELTQIEEDYMILEQGLALPNGLIKLYTSSSSYNFNIAVPRGPSVYKPTENGPINPDSQS